MSEAATGVLTIVAAVCLIVALFAGISGYHVYTAFWNLLVGSLIMTVVVMENQ